MNSSNALPVFLHVQRPLGRRAFSESVIAGRHATRSPARLSAFPVISCGIGPIRLVLITFSHKIADLRVDVCTGRIISI